MTKLPKAILFDLDETILSFGERTSQLTEVGEEFAAELSPFSPLEVAVAMEIAFEEFWSDPDRHREWRYRLKESRVGLISLVFANHRNRAPGLTPELAILFAEAFHERRESSVCLFPRALETIDELRRRGARLALVTNGHTIGQRRKIENFNLTHRFEHIQVESEVGFGKPEPRAYLHAVAALGVNPEESWMVGDNLEWEVAAPQRLGIHAIWHNPRGKQIPANSPVVPDRTIRCLSELLLHAR